MFVLYVCIVLDWIGLFILQVSLSGMYDWEGFTMICHRDDRDASIVDASMEYERVRARVC